MRNYSNLNRVMLILQLTKCVYDNFHLLPFNDLLVCCLKKPIRCAADYSFTKNGVKYLDKKSSPSLKKIFRHFFGYISSRTRWRLGKKSNQIYSKFPVKQGSAGVVEKMASTDNGYFSEMEKQ